MMMFRSLSFLLLLNGASALQLKVKDWECKEDAISANFDFICSEDNTCTLGEQGSIQGYMSYYGMVDQYGLDENSMIYMDFNMTLTAAGAPIYSNEIYGLKELSVCDQNLQAKDYDSNNGGCPYSGNYAFTTSFYLPPVNNSIQEWAYSGFNGKATLAIYMGQSHDSVVLGHCTMSLSSQTGNTGVKGAAPNGKFTMIAILSGVVVMLLMAIGAFGCACRRQGKVDAAAESVATAEENVAEETAKKVVRKPTSLNKPGSTEFRLMEDASPAKEKNSWKLDWDSNALTGTHAAQRSPIKKKRGFLNV